MKLTYNDFIEKVNEMGFLGPFMENIVPEGQTFSNDPDLDPWLWKDMVVKEKKLAYGSFFNGKKGYIAPRLYSVFIDAFRPRESIEERYESGKLGQYEWKFWKLLTKENRPLGTHEYRQMIGVDAKTGRSALDAAVVKLQMTFDVATVGNIDMLDKQGKPYNQSVGYDKMENWVPSEWMAMNPRLGQEEALETIYLQVEKNGPDFGQARKTFEKSLKLYKSFL